ncbi:PREDICTED: atherin-like [Cercocebus atys]|uniref:atherin-like n=1 Tax=Cercocebus atys TaxID=9531 RepID=UPI0005F52A37|nr:PREDICTED: atherin-like [Cercocebus atys]
MAGGGGARGRAGSVLASRSAAPSGLLRQRRIHFPNKQPELTETPPSAPPPPPPQQPPLLPPPPSFPPRPTTAQAQRLAPPCAAAARASRALAAHAPRARALTESWRARARLPRVSSGSFAAAALGAESLRSRAAVESQLKEAQGAGEAQSWTFSLPHLRDPHALRRGNDRHAVTVGRCSRELRVSRVRGRAGAVKGRVARGRPGTPPLPHRPLPRGAGPGPRPVDWIPRAAGGCRVGQHGSCRQERSCEEMAFEGSAGSKSHPSAVTSWSPRFLFGGGEGVVQIQSPLQFGAESGS